MSVTLEGAAAVADQLEASVSIDGGAPVESSVSLHGIDHGTIEIDFPSGYPSGRSVTVDIRALQGGMQIGDGTGTAALTGSCGNLSLTITGGATADLSTASDMGSGVVVTPAALKIRKHGTNNFMANVPVTWSVDEGAAGGTIDSSGLYTAPGIAGTFHVTATSVDDPTRSASATVDVAPFVLELLAGQLGGCGFVDDVGTSARFGFYGSAITADASSALYDWDGGNNVLRKITVPGGVVTTIAGAHGSFNVVDGVGSAAHFRSIQGLVSDGAGTLYISDDETVRKIVLATAMVTTIAGVPATTGTSDGVGAAARFNTPSGIAYDGAGNLYVSDLFNYTIRKIALDTFTVTTVVGTAGTSGNIDGVGTAAQLTSPRGLAMYAGAIYIADGPTIRKYVPATGAVTTIAGTPGSPGTTDGIGAAARFTLVSNLVSDGNGTLYVTDQNAHTIRVVVLASAQVTTLAGSANTSGAANGVGSAARFTNPNGIAMVAGNLYVSEENANCDIRQVSSATGTTKTFAGALPTNGSTDGAGSAARFSFPQGIATDGAGHAFVADTLNHTIRQVATTTGMVSTLAGTAGMSGSNDGTGAAASFESITGIAYDGTTSLYVLDSTTIRNVVIASGVVSTVAGTAGMSGTTDGTGAAARLTGGMSLTHDSAGDYYFAQSNSVIRKFVSGTATVSTLAGLANTPGIADGTGATARFNGPNGVSADGAGIVFIADEQNDTVRKMIASTQAVTTIAGAAGMPGSTDGNGAAARFNKTGGALVDGSGNLYVSDLVNGTIRKIVLATGDVTTFAGVAGESGAAPGLAPARLNAPAQMAWTSSGDLVFIDPAENAVFVIRMN